ncbi:MAG: Ldh family oxidoreductase [Spirochaetales bacterium]|nr:Ldh family oxidoreductase [Spirochaetales bacterium]
MDYTFNQTVRISFDIMQEWSKRLYMKMGMTEKDALTVAHVLVTADARSVYSHGCMRTSIFYNRITAGGTSATAQPAIDRERGATALIDGHNAMGQVVGVYAMNIAIEKAKQHGTSAVSIVNGNHNGTCAYFAEMALKENMIGLMWTNGGPVMAAWGGAERQLGNNPFGIAIPCLKRKPIVLDMAQSVVARGKIVMARKTKTPIPETWALDVNGKPTADAEAGYWGTVRPVGDYKGSALSTVISMLTAVLSGSAYGPTNVDLYEEPDKAQNIGQLMQVIDISAFTDVTAFKKRMDDYVDYLKNGKKAEGFTEIYVPGELEHNMFDKQMKEGITYPVEVIREYYTLCDKLGVEKMVQIPK